MVAKAVYCWPGWSASVLDWGFAKVAKLVYVLVVSAVVSLCVLSLSPDLILARSTSGPPETLDQLAASSVPIVLVEDKYSVAAVVTSVETIGAALGVPTKADALVAEIKDDW